MTSSNKYYHPRIRTNNDHCFYCNLYIERYEDRTRDHIIPRTVLRKTLTKEQRAELRDHIVMACHPCNSAKGAKSLQEFLESDFLKERIEWVKENSAPNKGKNKIVVPTIQRTEGEK